LKNIGVVSGFIKKIQGLSYDFGIFLDFSKLFFNRKSYRSSMWIMGSRLALSLWWIHKHGAAQPLRGSEGHCYNSGERI
jgi:hypothetical protein